MLPLMFLQGGMYAFRLFDDQMHRQIEAVAPETPLEQRLNALRSTLVQPSELAAAPTIGHLNGAPIMFMRGQAVMSRVSEGQKVE